MSKKDRMSLRSKPVRPTQESSMTNESNQELEKLEEQLADPVPTPADTPDLPAVTEEDVSADQNVTPTEPVSEATEPVEPPVLETAAPAAAVEVIDTTSKPVAPVAEEVVVPAEVVAVSTASSTASGSEEEQYLNEIRVNGADSQKKILAALESFCEETKPGKIVNAQSFTNAQFSLYSHFIASLNQEYNVFKGAWNVALVFFQVYHGDSKTKSAIGERYCNRYPYAWTRGQDKLSTLVNLFALLRGTRDRDTRAYKAKTFMLEKVGPGVLSAQAIENLQKFYNT